MKIPGAFKACGLHRSSGAVKLAILGLSGSMFQVLIQINATKNNHPKWKVGIDFWASFLGTPRIFKSILWGFQTSLSQLRVKMILRMLGQVGWRSKWHCAGGETPEITDFISLFFQLGLASCQYPFHTCLIMVDYLRYPIR